MASSRFSTLVSILVLAAFTGSVSSQTSSGFQYFSTRSIYDDIRGPGVKGQPGCTPVALWTLIRSGVSNPSSEELQEFSKLNELRNRIIDNHVKWNSGDLSDETIEALKTWSLNVNASSASRLAKSGINDTVSFIQRLQNAFPQLLHKMQSASHNIKHNSIPKSAETAALITSVLYNMTVRPNIPEVANIMERLEGECPSWSAAVKTASSKAKEFQESSLMKGVVESVSRKLGFNRLSYDIVKDIYDLCSYDRALRADQNSPWCSVFTESDLEAFEYEEDIMSYYTSGEGNPNHALIGCNFVSVFLQNFAVHESNHKVYFQVASGEYIRSVLSTLGIGRAVEPLSAVNFDENKSRSWKNSILSPFNANLVAVLNRCGPVRNPVYTVGLFVNEIPAALNFCNNMEFCEFNRFQRQYSSITNPSFCRKGVC